MKSNKGFTLIEVLVAMSIIMMLVATIVPIDLLLKQEKKILQDRRIISFYLHDELQEVVLGKAKLKHEQVMVRNSPVSIEFKAEAEWVKGCARWTNAKQKEESVCLYGGYEE